MTEQTLPGRCWWVVDGRLLAGGYPYNPGIDDSESFLRQLLASGIDAFVDLTEEDELTHYQQLLPKLSYRELLYRRFEIQDYSVPSIATMHAIVAHLNTLLDAGKTVYLHCRGGIGRSGTVAGCWLRSQGLTGEEALSEVARRFAKSNAARYTQSPETDEQRQMVTDYEFVLRE